MFLHQADKVIQAQSRLDIYFTSAPQTPSLIQYTLLSKMADLQETGHTIYNHISFGTRHIDMCCIVLMCVA